MKKVFLFAAAFLSLLSCKKDNKYEDSKKINVVSIAATADDVWYYYCGEAQKIVGTGVEADNDAWASSTNWDIAVQKYRIKTNGGTSSAQNAGGLAIYNGEQLFDNISTLPSGLDFKMDRKAEEMINGAAMLVSRSEYQVVNFVEGSMTEYNKAPIYILRGDTGSNYYKIDFTSYDADKDSGSVEFRIAQITK